MVSISAAGFEHIELWKLLDNAERLKKLGVGIELFADVTGFGEVDILKGHLAGLEVGMHCPAKDINLLAEEKSVAYRYTFERMESVLHSCRKLNAPYMVLHTNVTALPLVGDPDALRERGIERFRLMAAMAARYGVKIWVENVGFINRGNLLYNQEQYLDIFKQVPEVDALIDTGHAHINGWNTPEVIRALGSRLAGMHVNDNFGERDIHIRIGSGSIDFAAIGDAVRQLPRPPLLIVEYLAPTCDNLDAVLADCAELQTWR